MRGTDLRGYRAGLQPTKIALYSAFDVRLDRYAIPCRDRNGISWKIVDRHHPNPRHVADGWIDIAWHGEIDQ